MQPPNYYELPQLDPEEQKILMGLYGLNQRAQAQEKKRAQVEALRGHMGDLKGWGSAAAGGLAGIAHALNSLYASQRGAGIDQTLADISGEQEKGRNLYLDILRRGNAPDTSGLVAPGGSALPDFKSRLMVGDFAQPPGPGAGLVVDRRVPPAPTAAAAAVDPANNPPPPKVPPNYARQRGIRIPGLDPEE